MAHPDEEAVLAANTSFYSAFARFDFAAMDELWSSEAEVTCVHPGWPPIRGREPVMQSWRAIFQNTDGVVPVCEGPSCYVLGDAAYVLCRERLGGGVLVATNVFARGDGGWVLVHHHSSALARVPPTPPMDPGLLPN
ncbi:MAG: nuclear transport factor 2 family protein [Nannocystaceae bacterium]